MTELEMKLKAKIPGEDTGIEIRHSLCAICSPSHHCGLDCLSLIHIYCSNEQYFRRLFA